jgi:hypothetical protein
VMRRAGRAIAAAALGWLAACSGETGTLSVTLTQAPGSTLLDGVQTLRLTLTNPRRVVTAERGSSGFSLELELDATGEAGALQVEGLDASGTLIANGASPLFPVGALDGRIVIYMAAPLSVGASPVALDPARSELAIAPLPYGVLFAGGRLASGAPSDAVAIYNAFDHSVVTGAPLPSPRAAPTLVVGAGNIAYMFGGLDDTGAETANLWRFDTTIAPAGRYTDFGVKDGLGRADEVAVPLGNERFLVTGAPVAELRGLEGAVVVRDGIAALPPAGVTVRGNDGVLASIFAGELGVVVLRKGMFTTLELPEAARDGARVVALPGGKVVVVCGTASAVRIDAASGSADVIPGVPSLAKTGCAAAATARHLVIAGGTTATGLDGVVEIYETATLSLLATHPLAAARTGAVAIALPNDQVLIAAGVDDTGAPVGMVELFTPPLP